MKTLVVNATISAISGSFASTMHTPFYAWIVGMVTATAIAVIVMESES